MSDPHPEQLPAPEQTASEQKYWPSFASLTAGHRYRFVTVAGYEFIGTFHTTYGDGCLCVYSGDPPSEGYVNPTNITVAWELED